MTGDMGARRRVVVVGVDGSETSIRAGAYAAGVARRMPATLVVVFVHVVSPLAATSPTVIAAYRQASAEVVAELRRLISEATALDDLDVEVVERRGNPYTELVAVATERQADAVVVGASTSKGHRLVGSLAVHLVRDAQWPVTVVP